MADAPYPELKKTHTMARVGRPWHDTKPPPAAGVWSVIQGYVNYWALVAAVELGVFDAVGRCGSLTADALAAELGTDPGRTADLADALVVLGFLEAEARGFVLADAAERYLTTGGAATMTALVGVANGPHVNWPHLADTVRTGVPPAPVDDDPVTFYRPLVEATFPTQHRAALRLAARLGWARRPGLRVLDLGAGGAPWGLATCVVSAGATAVVNDLPGVIELAAAKAAALGLSERIELRPGDYHEVAIEDGAYDVVVLGHVCRAEGPDGARRLLQRAFAALAPEGTLVVADYVRGATRTAIPFAALMGLTLAASTRHGTTFTGTDLVGWLRAAGFEAVRFHEPIGGQYAYTAERPPAERPPAGRASAPQRTGAP